MKNLIKLLFLLVPFLLLTNCKKDTVTTGNEFEVLTEYMVQNNLDLPALLNGWVKSASGLGVNNTDYSVPNYYVIDLRSAADFDLGHIKDAKNVALANVLDEAPKAGGTPLLVVCYTGQTAARAVGLLRLMGYNAVALKWGMAGWNQFFAGKWASNAVDFASPNWLENGDPTPNKEFNLPVLNTGETDGQKILEARVRAALAKSWTITKQEVLDNPGNYFVNNKWPIASWDAFGHIKGAYRIDEDLKLANLKYLDPNATLVTYCYTGQTSAITTAWLDVLGYNGRSLMFGANGIAYNKMLGSDVDSARTKSWNGTGSGVQTGYGYYDASGAMHN